MVNCTRDMEEGEFIVLMGRRLIEERLTYTMWLGWRFIRQMFWLIVCINIWSGVLL